MIAIRRPSQPALRVAAVIQTPAATLRRLLALPLLVLAALLPGCAAAPPRAVPTDIEYAQAMATARTSYDRGQVAQAVLFYDRALQRAEARDDAADIGDAAYNLPSR